jgi:hypothetical protein
MKRTLVAIAALALAAVGVPAAPAAADNTCVITGYAPTSVVMGLSPRSIKASVTSSGSCDVDMGWTLSIDAPVYDSAFDFSPYFTIYPDDLSSTTDQTADVAASAYDTSGREVFLNRRNGLTIKKNTYWSYMNAWPENVRKGAVLHVGGQPRVANWTKASYDYGLTGGGIVDVQFNPEGPAGWSTVLTGAHNTAAGYSYATVTAKTTGNWRLHYRGTATVDASYSANDWIVVK